MSQYGVIEIVDKEGWRKSFSLEKAITFIGSAPGNDIVLQSWRGSGVAPRQLQVIAMPGDEQRCRVVNLGAAHLTVTGIDSRLVAPHSVGEITAGESVQFGDFSLILSSGSGAIVDERWSPPPGVFPSPTVTSTGEEEPAPFPSARQSAPSPQPGSQIGATRDSQVIGLNLVLPQTNLAPDHPVIGTIKVSNRGDETGVQFRIELEGLDPEFYEIGPAPILFPNAERDVTLEIRHPRGPALSAGEHRFRVRVTAPKEYPNEVAIASQVLHILPYYEHQLKVTVLE